MYQQPAVHWHGNKQVPGYNSPILNIPPEQYAQYLQQYQHQRMLQHLHQQHLQQQQQFQQQARHQQHAQRPDSSTAPALAAAFIHPSVHPSVNLSQYHAQQQQLQWSAPNGHVDPPARVASPFATHARPGSTAHPASIRETASDSASSSPHAAADLAADAATDAAADANSTATGAEPHHLDSQAKSVDAKPLSLPAETSDGPQSAPTAVLRPPQDEAVDSAASGATSLHSASYPPHAASMHEPSAARRLPPPIAMPAADAFTAAQDPQQGQAARGPPTLSTQQGQGVSSPSTSAEQPIAQAPRGPPPPSSSGLDGSASQHASVQEPPSPSLMMPPMHFPGQAYGVPMPASPANGRDVFPYGGMMMPVMPGMMLPPPPHQQSRPGRGNRTTAAPASSAGVLELAAAAIAVAPAAAIASADAPAAAAMHVCQSSSSTFLHS